jgi:hypothetical protein
MKTRIISAIVSLLIMTITFVVPTASAVNVFNGCNGADVDCAVVNDNSLDYTNNNNKVWNIVSLALFILSGVAVIMIVISGIRYATSAGDPSKVTSAKNTLLYSVIGLVVAISAAVIVSLINNYFG